MAGQGGRRKNGFQQFPRGHQDPDKLLSFIEATTFKPSWNRCALTDPDLFFLQTAILANPKGNWVVKGTGGLRKIRFSPPKSSQGKSGSHRACYVYFEEFGLILLITAYPKNKKDDLTPEERKIIRNMIEAQYKLLKKEAEK